jgi:hypothetical protein
MLSHPPGYVKKFFVTFPPRTPIGLRDGNYVEELLEEQDQCHFWVHKAYDEAVGLSEVDEGWKSVPVEFISESEVFDGTVLQHLYPEVRFGHERKTVAEMADWREALVRQQWDYYLDPISPGYTDG